ncbi:zinc transporter 7-like [Anarrhichthys ocellatus]|uniref:zinc transporter 7-like n=1 Tax=Anarrhichthys ocellatus TaxID=433405 RepID=UPI0012EDAD25|nr:zinc transporter 7-like [Anarrhichthys ocellatus]
MELRENKRPEPTCSQHWLLQEPLVNGAKMDIQDRTTPGLSSMLCSSGTTTLRTLVEICIIVVVTVVSTEVCSVLDVCVYIYLDVCVHVYSFHTCSVRLSGPLILSVVPLLRESIGILMQRTPPSLDHVLPECYQRVQQLQGVYNLQDPHFWTLCTDVYIGTLKLLVAPDADRRWILSQTHHVFTQAGVRQLYVQIDTADM